MAGGSGTRLWPLSRGKYPKQFLRLKGFDKSLFQMTVERCLKYCALSDIYVLTVKDYEFIVQLHIEEMGYSTDSVRIIIEPQPKNTLPAIYNAVKAINSDCGNSTVVVMTSDHLIRSVNTLVSQIKSGEYAAQKYIYTFGIHPAFPETGFGYIAPDDRLDVGYKIKEFKEKPTLETAKEYVDNGYFWNSGMFMFGTDLFEREVKEHAPAVYEAFKFLTPEECFEHTPNISIDYGVMERSTKTAVLPLDIDWDDLGSFATFYDTFDAEKDSCGNIGFDNEIFIDSADNLVYSQNEKMYALVGVKDLVVVDQGDALLVCGKEHTQNVKRVVQELKNKNDTRAELHLTEYQPWGSETVLEREQFYKIMRLTVLCGKQLSYQMHYHRSVHWVVVTGTATVVSDGVSRIVRSNESFFIPAGTKHKLRNDGKMPLEVIEVQSGQYLGEDDVVFFDED
jgi:mannose-1-phosphate guanylyltransferase/mannose-6-phosphate isomerase